MKSTQVPHHWSGWFFSTTVKDGCHISHSWVAEMSKWPPLVFFLTRVGVSIADRGWGIHKDKRPNLKFKVMDHKKWSVTDILYFFTIFISFAGDSAVSLVGTFPWILWDSDPLLGLSDTSRYLLGPIGDIPQYICAKSQQWNTLFLECWQAWETPPNIYQQRSILWDSSTLVIPTIATMESLNRT